MRVALLSPLFESVPPRYYGGTERVVSLLCQGLCEFGHEVTLFASGDSSVAQKGLPVQLIPVIDQALRLRGKSNASGAPKRAACSEVDLEALHAAMLEQVVEAAPQFDIIHNHHDYWMHPLSERVKTPVVSTVHGRLDLPSIRPFYEGYPHHGFVSISEAQRRPLPHLPWLATIPHGLDPDSLRFSPEPGSYLAFLGRISPEKRPDWAIQIALRAGIPLKMAAKIEPGASQQYFDSAIRPHLDGKQVEFIGEISDAEKSDFLGGALATLFPVDWPEPFGLVMVESLLCGTPVLARPCGSVPEVLTPGVTGFIEPSLTLLADRVAQVSQLSRLACRREAERRFCLKRMTEEYCYVYQQWIQREPSCS